MIMTASYSHSGDNNLWSLAINENPAFVFPCLKSNSPFFYIIRNYSCSVITVKIHLQYLRSTGADSLIAVATKSSMRGM